MNTTKAQWREVAYGLFGIVSRTGAWAHQGCGCEFGSRGEREPSPKCRVDEILRIFDECAEKDRY